MSKCLNCNKYIINNRVTLSKSLVSVFYMFYDNWNGIENESWKILLSYEL